MGVFGEFSEPVDPSYSVEESVVDVEVVGESCRECSS